MEGTVALSGMAVLCIQFGIGATARTQSSHDTAPQSRPAKFDREVGNLYSRYDRVPWQSPEAILAGLRSRTDDAIRLKALHLLGAGGEDAYEFRHGVNADSEQVAEPSQSELRYASLGDDDAQDAIVAVQVRNLVLIAVAIPTAHGWERVAAFKYPGPFLKIGDSHGSINGGNLLGTALDVGQFWLRGLRYELILTFTDLPTNGGRVLPFANYAQLEAHFRMYGGELRRTIAFERRSRLCQEGFKGCVVRRRWFDHGFGYASTVAGAMLVEAEGVARTPDFDFTFQTDLDERNLRFRSCSTLKLNDETDQYEPFSPSEMPIGAGCNAFAQGPSEQPRNGR